MATLFRHYRRALPRRFLAFLLVPTVLAAVGTVGFYLLEEEYTLFDSLYMTIITLTTVGYGEIPVPLSTAGRAFTMCLLLGGVFTLFYAATEIVRSVATGELQALLEKHRMEQNLGGLRDHLIVCGYGRMGRLVCKEFASERLPFVVIDNREGGGTSFDFSGGLVLHGDATSDEVLRRAGIERARALVTVVGSDADNLFITMSARLLNDKLFIVARAEAEGAEQKLLRAGANRVVSPYVIGGARVAHAVLRPAVVDFIELATRTEHLDLQIEEVRITAASRLVGLSLATSRLHQDMGIIIVAIKREGGGMDYNPASHRVLAVGDTLIALGHREQLDSLERLASG